MTKRLILAALLGLMLSGCAAVGHAVCKLDGAISHTDDC